MKPASWRSLPSPIRHSFLAISEHPPWTKPCLLVSSSAQVGLHECMLSDSSDQDVRGARYLLHFLAMDFCITFFPSAFFSVAESIYQTYQDYFDLFRISFELKDDFCFPLSMYLKSKVWITNSDNATPMTERRTMFTFLQTMFSIIHLTSLQLHIKRDYISDCSFFFSFP